MIQEDLDLKRFLDVIITDYTKFITIIKRLDSEKKELIEENLSLKRELRQNKDKIDLLKNTTSKEMTNIDMLRRSSSLEKIVVGDKDKF